VKTALRSKQLRCIATHNGIYARDTQLCVPNYGDLPTLAISEGNVILRYRKLCLPWRLPLDVFVLIPDGAIFFKFPDGWAKILFNQNTVL
jgi:hypothetical protein